MSDYELMHKNSPCGKIAFDDKSGRIISYKDNGNGYSPYLGSADLNKMHKWWEMRAVPASRLLIQNLLKTTGCLNSEMYLAKNLALSMTDSYWLRPEGTLLKYDDVKFSNLSEFSLGKVPYHNATSYDPNASLGGQMEKYWEFGDRGPVLVKESSKYFGQQSVNEVFATMLHQLQKNEIPFVTYTGEITADNSIICKCDAFTSEDVEFISAYEILESQKNSNSTSLYDQYIDLCIKNGIDAELIQEYMDYQTTTDFLISNVDEHLQNFGVLRDTNTMKLLGPAPIFDSGNSMFYSENRNQPYTRAGLLERPITSFYKTEDKMLAKVKNRNVIKFDLLPEPKVVQEFYEQAGIPLHKAELIRKNYETKLELFKEFQHGKNISLFQEKRNERNRTKLNKQYSNFNSFIVVCGIPGSGKTLQADKLCHELSASGKKYMDSINLYPIQKTLAESGMFLNKQRIMNELHAIEGYKDSVVVISANSVRKEFAEQNIKESNDQLFLTIEARIKIALMSGATVIYEATNLDKEIRTHLIDLANEVGVSNKVLYIMDATPQEITTAIPLQRINAMYEMLKNNYPTETEGWTSVNNCRTPVRVRESLDDIEL